MALARPSRRGGPGGNSRNKHFPLWPGRQRPAWSGMFQNRSGKGVAGRMGPGPREPTAVPLSQMAHRLDTSTSPPLPGSPEPTQVAGTLPCRSSGQLGLQLLTAGWCLSLAQEAPLPSGKKGKKRKGKENLSAFLTQPLLPKAPGWCHPASVGTQPPPSAAYSPVCP